MQNLNHIKQKLSHFIKTMSLMTLALIFSMLSVAQEVTSSLNEINNSDITSDTNLESEVPNCENTLKKFLSNPKYKEFYSSVWISNYIQCDISSSEFEQICLMKTVLYPKGNIGQKTENFIVGISNSNQASSEISSSNSGKVFLAKSFKLKEDGMQVELDLKPVMLSKKSEKVQIHMKKLQVTQDSGNINSVCTSHSVKEEFIKF